MRPHRSGCRTARVGGWDRNGNGSPGNRGCAPWRRSGCSTIEPAGPASLRRPVSRIPIMARPSVLIANRRSYPAPTPPSANRIRRTCASVVGTFGPPSSSPLPCASETATPSPQARAPHGHDATRLPDRPAFPISAPQAVAGPPPRNTASHAHRNTNPIPRPATSTSRDPPAASRWAASPTVPTTEPSGRGAGSPSADVGGISYRGHGRRGGVAPMAFPDRHSRPDLRGAGIAGIQGPSIRIPAFGCGGKSRDACAFEIFAMPIGIYVVHIRCL